MRVARRWVGGVGVDKIPERMAMEESLDDRVCVTIASPTQYCESESDNLVRENRISDVPGVAELKGRRRVKGGSASKAQPSRREPYQNPPQRSFSSTRNPNPPTGCSTG